MYFYILTDRNIDDIKVLITKKGVYLENRFSGESELAVLDQHDNLFEYAVLAFGFPLLA